jgi:hypothetical protein
VSSGDGCGWDTGPTATWWHDALYVAWTSDDDGVGCGPDVDVVYRKARPDAGGDLLFDGIQEVSEPADGFNDSCPELVVFNDTLECVWIGCTPLEGWTGFPAYLYLLEDVVLMDMYMRSVDVPFHRGIRVDLAFDGGAPVQSEPTWVRVTVADLAGEPVRGARVQVIISAEGGGDHHVPLVDYGGGEYVSGEFEVKGAGCHTVSIVVDGVEVDAVEVDVTPTVSFEAKLAYTAILLSCATAIGLVWFARNRD